MQAVAYCECQVNVSTQEADDDQVVCSIFQAAAAATAVAVKTGYIQALQSLGGRVTNKNGQFVYFYYRGTGVTRLS